MVEVESDRPIRLPNDQEMVEAVNRGLANEPLDVQMADRIGVQAMQDPWAQFRQRSPPPQNADESFATHNPQGLGFRLVTEKSL